MMEHKRRKHRGNGGNDRREFPEINGRITEMVQIKDGISVMMEHETEFSGNEGT